MQKRKISGDPQTERQDSDWLQLETIADVEITSEQVAYPIEAALLPGKVGGWRAEQPGEQRVRLVFAPPRALQRVRVVIEEHSQTRTQQILLRSQAAPGGAWQELVRQQFNFSPSGATREEETFRCELPTVAALELVIIPDISGGNARASILELRVA